GVLDEGDRTAIAGDVAEQPDPLLPQAPESGDVLRVARDGVTGRGPGLATGGVERAAELLHLGRDGGRIVRFELDEVDRGERRLVRALRDEVRDRVPDEVLLREPDDGVVDRLDRARIGAHEHAGGTEGGVEVRVADRDELAVLR